MAIYVAAVQKSGGQRVEHVVGAIWVNETFKSGKSSLNDIIDFVDKNPGQLKVTDGKTVASVEVVRPRAGRPYIRSQPDATKTDNLLSLNLRPGAAGFLRPRTLHRDRTGRSSQARSGQPSLGTLAGMLLVSAAGLQCFPTMGQAMHGQDPELFGDRAHQWARQLA